jgi:hypothetical protein
MKKSLKVLRRNWTRVLAMTMVAGALVAAIGLTPSVKASGEGPPPCQGCYYTVPPYTDCYTIGSIICPGAWKLKCVAPGTWQNLGPC